MQPHNHRRGARRGVGALLALLMLAFALALSTLACSSGEEPSPPPVLAPGTTTVSEAGVVLEVSSEPIKLGANDLGVQLKTPGATLVGVSVLMPSHGHGSRPPIVEPSSAPGGYTVRDVIMYMSGRWEIRFRVNANGAEHDALVVVDVP